MLTLSTILTIFRIILAPLISFKIIEGQLTFALILFVIAAISDVLDGFLARALNQETTLGAFLDPLADKILILSIFYTMTFNLKSIPKWFLLLLLSKELILVLGSIFFYLKKNSFKIKPTVSGKALTFLEVLLILAAFLSNVTSSQIYFVILLTISILAVTTLIQYIYLAIKQYRLLG